MNFHLKIWRQPNARTKGRLVDYEANDISSYTSFLEMLDIVNEQLVQRGEEPIAFDSDCREGICGVCSLTINGEAHGPDHPGAVCELYMRRFKDRDTIVVEPFRARAFPIIKDLVIDRSALDRVVQAGGFISARTGSAPEANSILVPKKTPTWLWKRRPALVVAHAWRRVQMLRRCCLQAQKFPISPFCRKAHRNVIVVFSAWFARWTRKPLAIAQTFMNASRFARRTSAEV